MKRRSFFQLTDRGNGEIDLFWVRVEGDTMRPRAFPRAMPFDNPITDDDRKSVRWYLEEFLLRPLNPERSRARHVEERLQMVGAALFQQVFRDYEEGMDPRAFFGEAADAGLAESEPRVLSDDPSFLNIPWELLFESSEGFLGQQFGGVVRHPVDQATAPPLLDPAGPFRILLVTARPNGPRDYQLRTMARALPRAVRSAWPRVQVEVLRPPSFGAFTRRLVEQPGGFQFIHIDGHAVGNTREATFSVPAEDDGRRRRRRRLSSEEPDEEEMVSEVRTVQEGRLIFETADGRPDTALADSLAAALVNCRARLVVLSALATSTEPGESPHALVASQLVRAGVPGVVLLPYPIDSAAAERFLGPMYTRILAGDSLAEAVAEGRRALSAERRRGSLLGPLPLQDWFVPRLYQHSGVLQPVRAADDPPEIDTGIIPEPPGPVATEHDVRVRQHVGEVCRPGRFGLIGRDGDLLRLDAALSNPNRPWVLLSGAGGIGKSTLASEFGRWYYETGGCPGGVFVSSFESRADFGQVLGSVVTRREDFWRYDPEERVERLLDHLRATPCLLILDHLETVAGYPVGAPPLASERDRRDLGRFLQGLHGGKTRVLMTSRKTDEIWLGVGYVEMPLEGLASQPAGVLAALILRSAGKDVSEFAADRDYGRLLELLQGHPRALEVSLPHLRWLSPGELLDALKRAAAGAPTMLDGYQSLAFERLSPTTQRHLPATGLFSGVINADLGSMMYGQADARPDGYRAIVGESPDRAGWRAILAEAAAAGLLRDLGRGRYQIHSTLTPILRRRLAVQVGEDGVRRLDRELISFFAGLSGKLGEGVRRGDANAVGLLTFEMPNLVRVLRAAGSAGDWARVFPIARVLAELTDAQGRHDEWARLRDALLARMGNTVAPDGAGGDLWRFLTTSQAREAMRRRDYAGAETIYRRLLTHFQSWNSPRAEPAVATIFGQLGRVSEEREAWEEAELWYRQALEIRESRGQVREAATVAQQLGVVVAAQERFEDAEVWYAQALERFQELGLEREAATAMQRIGQFALHRRRLADADTWLQQAVAIVERLELPREAATMLQSLGQVAYERERMDEAEVWYGKALELYEQLGLDAEVAATVYALGTVMVAAQRPEPAEQLLIRAVELARNSEQYPLHLDSLLALAKAEEARRDQTAMVRNLGQALDVAADYVPLRRREVIGELARVMPAVGEDRLRRLWQALFGGENPPMDEILQMQLNQAS